LTGLTIKAFVRARNSSPERRPEKENPFIQKIECWLMKDNDGKIIIQEDMPWGDSPTYVKKPVLAAGVANYVEKWYPNDDLKVRKGMEMSILEKLQVLHTDLMGAARMVYKSELFAYAYDMFGICYIDGNEVLPATTIDAVVKSWGQDWSDGNMGKIHQLFDHYLQRQKFWSSGVATKVMKKLGLVYDKDYSDFRDRNRTKLGENKKGPKYKDGVDECCLFAYKKMRDTFRKGNVHRRNFIMPRKAKKGLYDRDLDDAIDQFIRHNPILTRSVEDRKMLKRTLHLKEKHKVSIKGKHCWDEEGPKLANQVKKLQRKIKENERENNR
jgi:hypothetical protein